MAKHKHAEMIKAKADNMELVVFVKKNNTNEWWEVFGDLPFNQQQDFFVCLPKHKDAVLNVLNGGMSQVNYGEYWSECNCNEPIHWFDNWWYMDNKCESRIKPRKEKRWIVAKPIALVSMMYFNSKSDAEDAVKYSTGEFKGVQVIEIEVEV